MAEKVEIAVVINFPFPNGIAATNRLISYLKLFVREKDKVVKVYITKPTEKRNNVQNKETKGEHLGIRYEYLSHTTIRPKNKIIRLISVYVGYFRLVYKIIRERPEIVITYTSDYYIKKILLLLRKMFGNKVLFEETEYPKVLLWSRWKNKKEPYLMQYKKSNGMIVMTKELKSYYSSLGVKRIYHLPMTVDHDRFRNFQNQETKDYFIYVGGDGGFARDGIIDIVKGYKIALDMGLQSKLLLVGEFDTRSMDYKTLDSFIQKNMLQSSVVFTGKKRPFEIPDMIMQAKGIIMAPPKNFPSGGFPTKLGEFLASSRPVICTRVSEIANYLNNDSCFLVEPQNVHQIAEAIMTISTTPALSRKIGLNGKNVALKEFNAENHVNDLMEFIFS